MPVTWSDEKLILLYCPGRGSNSRPSAHRSFKHGQGVPRPLPLGHVLSYVYSKQCGTVDSIFGLTQEWLKELSFSRLECGVHDKLHISSADWWDILFPLAYTPYRRDRRLLCVSSERHWQSGVNGIANVPKRSCRIGIRTQDHPVSSPTL